MEEKFLPLDLDEVISANTQHSIGVKHPTCTVEEFLDGIAHALQHYATYSSSSITWDRNRYLWFTEEGVEGRALQFRKKGWQSGRLRLSIEFCPDEPEVETREMPLLEASVEPVDSPLDEIRRLAGE